MIKRPFFDDHRSSLLQLHSSTAAAPRPKTRAPRHSRGGTVVARTTWTPLNPHSSTVAALRPKTRTPRHSRGGTRAHVASRTRHYALRTRDYALPSQTPASLRAPRFGSLPMPTPFRTEPLTPRNLPLHAPACTQAREAVAVFCAHTILPPDVCCIHPTRARARPACCLPRSLVGSWRATTCVLGESLSRTGARVLW